jgi:hypothetical protein
MATTYRLVPWQRNLLKVPTQIVAALSAITSDLVVIAVTKKVTISDIEKGVYNHLGLKFEHGQISSTPSVIPPTSMGRFSTRNIEGWEIVREDLPMITKTFSWETPNFGDASTYGTHTHYRDREVYQREYYEPQHLPITTEVLNVPNDAGRFALIKFAVDDILDRTRADFEHNLFFNLNLLQENVGATNIYASTATRQEYIGTIALDWEVFPPGTVEEVIAILSKDKGSAPKKSGVLEERVKLFSTLKPKAYLRGVGGFGAYIGAQFADDLVVFENMNYGNALYVLYSSWEDVSKRSRLDLLNGTNKDYDRFIHTADWEERFKDHMATELRKRNPPELKSKSLRRR